MVEDFIYHGKLISGETITPVQVAYGTRASLLVHFENKDVFEEHAEYDGLIIDTGDKELSFGVCHLSPIRGEGIPGFVSRIVFTDNVYDFNNIFAYRRSADLESYFQNLRVIKAQKGKIRDSFKDYVSALTYDLRVYKKFFDEFDIKYADEPPEIYAIIQDTVIRTEGAKYFEFFNDRLRGLAEETADFTREEHELHGYFFRRQAWDLIQTSEFALRSNVKPRGYAGDSEMMTMIYEDAYVGETIFAKLMHKHPIMSGAAQAVRNRKIMVPEKVLKCIKQRSKGKKKTDEKVRIMTVACGPAQEMENIVNSPEIIDKVEFTFLDQDRSALGEAAENVMAIESRLNKKLNKKFRQESVRTLVKKADLSKEWGQFDYIYSMGLYDYLTVRVAQAVTEKLYNLLKPGGELLIGNYHDGTETRLYMEYWLDWNLIYRTEEEMVKVAKKIPNANTKVEFEGSKSQMFLTVKKPEKI